MGTFLSVCSIVGAGRNVSALVALPHAEGYGDSKNAACASQAIPLVLARQCAIDGHRADGRGLDVGRCARVRYVGQFVVGARRLRHLAECAPRLGAICRGACCCPPPPLASMPIWSAPIPHRSAGPSPRSCCFAWRSSCFGLSPFPSKRETGGWTAPPVDFDSARRQWEYAFAGSGVLSFIGLLALVRSIEASRPVASMAILASIERDAVVRAARTRALSTDGGIKPLEHRSAAAESSGLTHTFGVH